MDKLKNITQDVNKNWALELRTKYPMPKIFKKKFIKFGEIVSEYQEYQEKLDNLQEK